MKATPETPWEKLLWMQENAHHIRITTDEHRVYYDTVTQNLETRDHDLFDDEDAEVKAECIRRGQLAVVVVYPVTPIGFYRVGHYDLGRAIELAYECTVKDLRTTSGNP